MEKLVHWVSKKSIWPSPFFPISESSKWLNLRVKLEKSWGEPKTGRTGSPEALPPFRHKGKSPPKQTHSYTQEGWPYFCYQEVSPIPAVSTPSEWIPSKDKRSLLRKSFPRIKEERKHCHREEAGKRQPKTPWLNFIPHKKHSVGRLHDL